MKAEYNEKINLVTLSKLIFQKLNSKRKKGLIILLIFMAINSFTAVLNLAIVIPFITILSSPNKLWDIEIISKTASLMNIENTESLIFLVTVFFIISVFLSSLTKLTTLYFSNRLSGLIGSDLSYEGFLKILNQPFEWHIYEKSSSIITALTDSINKSVSYVKHNLEIITASVTLVSLSFVLYWVEPIIFLTSLSIILSFYLLIMLLIRKKLDSYSKKIKSGNIKIIEITQDSIGSIINIKIDNTYKNFLSYFKINEIPLRQFTAKSNFLSQFPKYILEALSIILIIILAYFLTIQNQDDLAIQKIGILAFAAQKMLPEIQKVFASWAQLKTTKSSALQIINILNIKFNKEYIGNNLNIYFLKDSIQMKNLDYSYPYGNKILKKLNFQISVGEKVGLVGETGCGKSTFLNIFMGLLKPKNGEILIDNKKLYSNSDKDLIQRFQMSISYVPQNFYICDGTILDNIAYGQKKEELDLDRAYWAAEICQMIGFIEKSDDGLKLRVGERGINLSGGQKQRLIIARAIYKNSNILILDEATSALDEKTELKLLNELYKLNTTNIIVSHKASTLKTCDRIIKIEDGKVI